jgi:hypothetical protein
MKRSTATKQITTLQVITDSPEISGVYKKEQLTILLLNY